ncbi:MAG: ABC transporter permease [Spirochaetota bacterium]
MERVTHTLRVYVVLVRASVRAQMRYKASMTFDVLGYFAIFWSEFAAIWILFTHFGTLAGWRFEEVLVCYGLAHLSYSVSEFLVRGFEHLANLTRRGEYDRMLLRPVDTVVQLAGFEFAIHRFGRTLQAAIVLAVGLVLLGEPISAVRALALLWGLVGGAGLFSGVYILQGAVGMKTLQNIEAFNILTNGGPEMAQFPMSIYPRPMRLLFTFLVPLAGVVYYPTVTFLRKSAEASLWLGWVGPIGGLLFLAGALMVFRVVERSYISTGS